MGAQRHILFLPRWYPLGNVQNGVFIQKHARAAALRNKVVVLYAESTTGAPGFEVRDDGNLREALVRYKKSGLAAVNFCRYALAIARGWRFIKKSGFHPDLCHVNMLNRSALLALWLRWRFHIPYIITEHWSGYVSGSFKNKNAFSRWFTEMALRNAAIVTVVSPFLKNGMINLGLQANYRILPNVVEVSGAARSERASGDTFRFLVVADLKDKHKNVSGVLKAFHRVVKEKNAAELLIAGDGADRKMLEDLSGSLGLNGQAHFLGELDNPAVLKLIASVDAMIINSRFETFSVVTLEAIFSGVPVIVARCGGPEPFIVPANGMLINRDDEDALVNAMREMMKNRARYVPETVKSSLENSFTLKAVAASLALLYEEVIALGK